MLDAQEAYVLCERRNCRMVPSDDDYSINEFEECCGLHESHFITRQVRVNT